MTKVTFVGAGSTVFAKTLIGDVLTYPELSDCTIVLHDIDPVRLETSAVVAERIRGSLGVGARIEATTDRERALDGADFAVTTINVGGYEPATVTDFAIPKRYGLRQTIGDTLGIGGIMRALRTIPVLLDIDADMQRLCPDVLHLQHSNPMAMNCWALARAGGVRTVGLCHSVQGTAKQLAADVGVPSEEVDYRAAGINHMAFYLKLEHDGVDLTPALQSVIDEERVPDWNRVRYEVFRRLGYFVTESSEHFAEYVPWFIKRDRPDLIERFNVPLDEYLARCQRQIAGWDALRDELTASTTPLEVRRSEEYGSRIIHSVVTGQPRVVYGNVANDGLIDNLPDGCCVEVPCLVDANGVQPTRVGALPPHLAALMQTNVNVQGLTVEAALTGKREHVYHAAMLDPHTAAELDLDQIHSLVDELLEAHGSLVRVGPR
ncbi:MAG TPA: alpha-glucosidase/alpha-galactosidase [Trueperaceae bacterium]|nr:alpha-glucosidase/alpha-galactosidase [Trueperaceae bacterium]